MSSSLRKWWALKMEVAPWAWDPLICFLWEMGSCGLEIKGEGGFQEVIAYWPEGADPVAIMRELESWKGGWRDHGSLPPILDLKLESLDEGRWIRTPRGTFEPIQVTRHLIVSPPWKRIKSRSGVEVLRIKPGQAFGTGIHETTRLCLHWLDRLLKGKKLHLEEALDLGTGTGILAIAMAKLGVKRVWALDTDPVAVKEARDNTRRNRVECQVVVLRGSLERVREKRFPMMVANLTAQLLREMSREIVGRLCEGGILVLSGILKEEAEDTRKSFEEEGMVQMAMRGLGEWTSLLMERRREPA